MSGNVDQNPMFRAISILILFATPALSSGASTFEAGGKTYPAFSKKYVGTLTGNVQLVAEPSVFGGWKNWWNSCVFGASAVNADTKVDVLYKDGDYVAVKIPQKFGCTFFNPAGNIAFIRSSDVTNIMQAEDAVTDGGLESKLPKQDANVTDLQAVNEEVLSGEEIAAQMEAEHVDMSTMKTEEEMAAYMHCFSGPFTPLYDQYYRKLLYLISGSFVADYRKGENMNAMIGRGQEENGNGNGKALDPKPLIRANPLIMACMSFRESTWNPDSNRQKGGAKGLGQQTSINMTEIRETLKKYQWARDVWDNYFVEAKKAFTEKEWKALTHDTENPSRECGKYLESDVDAFCPVTSLASMALYQMIIEKDMRNRNTQIQELSYDDSQAAMFETLKGLGHNAGAPTIGLGIQNEMETALNRILGKGTEENRDYAEYLHNCLTHLSTKSMHENDKRECNLSKYRSRREREADEAKVKAEEMKAAAAAAKANTAAEAAEALANPEADK